ncbi:MAG: hypothetical protein RR057_03505, partial [Clostridia bacterium]
MILEITPSQLNGEVKVPTSKSIVQRLLFCAAASDKETEIICDSTSDDIEAAINVLNQMGAKIDFVNGKITVIPINCSNISKNGTNIFNCGESATTARFALSFAAIYCKNFTICGEGTLKKRSFKQLCDVLREAGLKISSDTLPISVTGKLRYGDYKINCDITSQHASSLLIALSALKECSTLTVDNYTNSGSYINITEDVLNKYRKNLNITINNGKKIYKINDQPLISNGTYSAEGDWSSAAYWLCAAAVNGNIKVNNLFVNTFQGDKSVIDVLKKCNADIKVESDFVTVKKSIIKSFEFSAKNAPDLVMPLAFLACFCKGTSIISDIKRLKYKETNRIIQIVETINAFGGYTETDG